MAQQRGPSGLFRKVASDEETALHPPVAGEAPALVRARGRGGRFMRLVTAATSLPSLDSAAANLVAADWRDFCWMTGTGTGGLFGFPQLRQKIAMADLLVNGHIELKTRNDIILGTSK